MPYSRRSFLKTTAVAVAGASLFDARELFAAGPFTRLDVGPMTASSPTLVSYGNAIKAMTPLPSTDPLSWAYQAAIHGTKMSGSYPAWKSCEPGTHYFWAWHRMYLYWCDESGKLAPKLVASGALVKGQRAAVTRNEVNLTIGKARLALWRLKKA